MFDSNFYYKFYYGWWKNIDKFILLLILSLFFLGLFFSLVSTSLIASDKVLNLGRLNKLGLLLGKGSFGTVYKC